MAKKKTVLKGEAANQFLRGVAKPTERTIEQRLGDISFQLHKLNETINKLMNNEY